MELGLERPMEAVQHVRGRLCQPPLSQCFPRCLNPQTPSACVRVPVATCGYEKSINRHYTSFHLVDVKWQVPDILICVSLNTNGTEWLL